MSFINCKEADTELSQLTGAVSIAGTAQVEQTLTADTGRLDGSGEISYQWKRNGTAKIGGGSSSYVIEETAIGSFITLTVTRSGYSGSVTSAPTAVVTDASFLILGGIVSISCTAIVGQIFTADNLYKRCAEYASSPPPADWNGVEVMKTK